jgi:hypothetical protein
MNVTKTVQGIMSKATLNWAQNEKVSPSSVNLGIRLLGNDELEPTKEAVRYFVMISKKPKLTESGGLYYLNFAKEILFQKFDTLGYSVLSGQFIRNYFHQVAQEFGKSVSTMDIVVQSQDELCTELFFIILDNGKPFKKVALKDVFGQFDD